MINNKEKNFISAVIYVHNNENQIEETLRNINTAFKENFDKYEIICVNDASTDKSVEIIKKFTEKLNNEVISIINMSYYQGTEIAMNAGIDFSIGDFVYEFDNVIQDYDDKIIINVYNKCLEGFDIVSATSQNNTNNTSSIFYNIFNAYSNLEYKIHTETFRILSRRAINRVHSIAKNIPYRKALYANCGLKIYNLNYKPKKKIKRKFNKQAKRNRKDIAINSLILFTNIGYKFSIIMSLIMIIATIFVTFYTIAIFISGNPVQGWTTTMLFLSFAFFGLFTIMTIIIKYLDILLELIFKKNNYIIEGIYKLN